MFVAAVLGWPPPLVAIQILWINLVTDSLPALALGMEAPEQDIMERPPRPPKEPVINSSGGLLILYYGALMALAALTGFWLVYNGDPADEENLRQARTAAFGITAASQLFFSFGCRSHHRTLLQLGLLTNPWLLAAIAISGALQLGTVVLPVARSVFETTMPTAPQWATILLLALVPITMIEVTKLLRWVLVHRRT
jgi:Ca2+-transporting ATPase